MASGVHADTQGNLDIQLTTKPVNGTATASIVSADEPTRISINIKGKYDGGSVSGLHPSAWIRPRLNNAGNCKNAVRNYLSTGANASRDIDLNSYSFITLNQDNSIGILDPRLNLASANLMALKKLDTSISDWHLDTARGEIFLGLPNKRKLRVLSALNGEHIADIPLQSSPQKLLALKNDTLLWVASEQALMAVDTQAHKLLKTIPLKSGTPLLAISEDQEQIWIYAKGELIAVDTVSLETLWRRQLPKNLSSISYSSQADKLYFGSHDKLEITALYPGDKTPIETIPLKSLPKNTAVTPNGRWLFSMDFGRKQLTMIDTVNSQPMHHLLFAQEFDQLVFSDQYAYLHHTTSSHVSLINVSSLNTDETPALIEVPFGTTAPGEQPSTLPLITPLPEGGAVIVNNPADKTLYLYMEDGMLAPANAFKLYTAAPLSMLVHDKTLTETQPGVYETVTLIPRPGDYELVFYLNSPLLISCIPLTVKGTGASVASAFQTPVHDIELSPGNYHAGIPAEVRFKLLMDDPPDFDAAVKILLFKPGSNWQQRMTAHPNPKKEYLVSVVFPSPGEYLLGMHSAKLKLDLNQKQMKTIEVAP
jgi:hypothetical protein